MVSNNQVPDQKFEIFLEVLKIFDNVFWVFGVALSEHHSFKFSSPVFKIVWFPGSTPNHMLHILLRSTY